MLLFRTRVILRSKITRHRRGAGAETGLRAGEREGQEARGAFSVNLQRTDRTVLIGDMPRPPLAERTAPSLARVPIFEKAPFL